MYVGVLGLRAAAVAAAVVCCMLAVCGRLVAELTMPGAALLAESGAQITMQGAMQGEAPVCSPGSEGV